LEAVSRKKSLSGHLSRHDVQGDDFVAAVHEISNGSDRVAAIMGAALLEDGLLHALVAALEDPSDKSALFYDQGAPFGTFRARIIAGKGLGLYGEALAQDMDIVRDIRNQFAHALLSIDFANPHIVERCNEISDHRPPDLEPPRRGVSAERLRYEDACWEIHKLLLDKSNTLLAAKIAKIRHSLTPSAFDALHNAVTSSLQGCGENVGDDMDPD
jgi:hypothetical protein